MKKFTRIFLCIIIMIILAFSSQIHTEAYSGMFNLYRKSPQGEHYGLYKYDNVMYLYDESGEKYQRYSGFTKTKNGDRRYYVTGDVCKGWRKINKKWYYFDFSDGNAFSGKEIIAGGKYYFNDNFSWSGKLSKNAKYTDDFSLTFKILNMDSDTVTYKVDSINRTFIMDVGEKTKKKIKLSKMDIQAFYSMILSCDITKIKAKVTGYNIENNNLFTGFTPPEDEDNPEDCDYIWSDPEKYIFNITFNGNKYEVFGDDSAFLFVNSDKTVEKFCQMVWFMKDYGNNIS